MAEEQSEQVVGVCAGDCEATDRGLFDFLGKKKVAGEEEKAEEEYLAAGVQNIHIEEGYKAHEGRSKEDEDLRAYFERSDEKKEDEKLQEAFYKSEEKKEEEKLQEAYYKSEEKKEEEKLQDTYYKSEEKKEEEKLRDSYYKSEEKKDEEKLQDTYYKSEEKKEESDEEEVVVGEGGIKEKIRKKKKDLMEKIEGLVHRGEERHEEEKKPEHVQPQPAEESKLVVEEFELQESAVPEGEKKGFLEKIKEKLPGHGKKPAEEGAPVLQLDAVEATEEKVQAYEAVEGPEAKEKKGFLGKIIEKLPGYHRAAVEESDKGPASH